MPKVTSLSEQLKRLQVPQTNVLASINDQRRVSFLYDPKEAANLDSEAVYSIAVNGLEQLKAIDQETFESFELTLFNSTSLSFERGIQTKQVNESIDNEIHRYLIHLSPYFMLKPAHKTLEWLVYRYQVHIYNINDLFMCILPYHETNFFVRAVQLIDFKNSNAKLWSWLEENQKHGVQLAASSLATHVFSDLSFFNFLIDYLNETIKIFDDEDSVQSQSQKKHWNKNLNLVLSFMCKTLIQSIKNLSDSGPSKNWTKIQESFFAQLLPVVFTGFKSTILPYKQTSYLIASFLFEKFNFTSETTNKTLYALTKGLSQFRENELSIESIDCLKSAILAICLITQSQFEPSQTNLMSKNFLKKLLKNFCQPQMFELFLSTVDDLNQNYCVDKFLRCFTSRLLLELIEEDKENNSDILIDLDSNEVDLDEIVQKDSNDFFKCLTRLFALLNLNRMPSLIESTIEQLFSQSVISQTTMSNMFIEYHLIDLINKFETKYPVQFDSVLNKFLLNLDKPTKSKFLNFLSTKFRSLTLKTVFKYREIDNNLSLLLSLNHQNESVRANGLAYLLKLVSLDPKLDPDFVKTQLEAKLGSETSSDVYREVLNFGALLLNYFPLDLLINHEDLLLKVFTNRIYPRILQGDENNEEIRQNMDNMAAKWLNCRSILIDLFFNQLFKLYPEKDFFDLFLNVSGKLFELSCVRLINELKSTDYFKKLQCQAQSEPSSSPMTKKFYSVSSSITVTKLNPDTNQVLNENFESFIQLSVKSLLSKKDNNCVTQPECFDKLNLELNGNKKTGLNVIDFYVFEISTRLGNQCLFLQNSQFFLNIALNLLKYLKNFIKIKKLKNLEALDIESKSKHVSLSEYLAVVGKQSIKNFNTLLLMYNQFFRSISVQISNFVNKNSAIEIENIMENLYTHLCTQLESNESLFAPIMTKFITSNCFCSNISHTPTHTPTKAANGSGLKPNTISFYQFVFKFLLQEEPCRLQTIILLTHGVNDFLNFNQKTDYKLIDSFVLAFTWALASQSQLMRQKTLLLFDELQKNLDDTSTWKHYVKKLLKHRQEIEIDGADYVRTKSLNKIFASDAEIVSMVEKSLEFSLNKLKNTHQLAQFVSAKDLDTDSGCHILVLFKHMLLDLCKQIKQDFKIKYLNVLFQILVQLLTESNLLIDTKDSILVKTNKQIINVISREFILTPKSASFFNQNNKCFDYLIGYLNNKNMDKSAEFVQCFKMNLVGKLSSGVEFFKLLDIGKQSEFAGCLFDSWLFNSDKLVEESLTSGDDIQQNSDYLEQIKISLINFDLTSAHLIHLLNTKTSLQINKTEANTTKQMKKQLHSDLTANNGKVINWRALKLVLDLLQSNLVKKENSMEVDGQEPIADDYIDLIPYLFLVLESIETKFLITEQGQENQDDFLYFEISCLNSLLQIYKLNKMDNKSKLDQSKFNIELLMQILQTKRDNQYRLNVQQHILILLSEIAGIFPEKVLEHVLIMFVFVGNKLARKDDSYSFQIISLIIKSILPAIVNSVNSAMAPSTQENLTAANRLVSTVNVLKRHEKQLPYVSSLVCKILQSFVVALPHIPAHRKAIIFDQLMNIIGLNDYLWITIIQSIDHYLVQSSDLMDFSQNLEKFQSKQQQLLANRMVCHDDEDQVSKNEKKLRDTLKSCISCMISLHVQFEPMQLIQSSVYLVAFLTKYLASLFTLATNLATNSKDQRKKVYSHLACQLDHYNLLQMKYLAYNLLSFVSDLLVSDTLVSKLADFYESKQFEHDHYAALFEKLLENVLLLILKLNQVLTGFEQAADIQPLVHHMTKFHKALMNKSYDLLERLINLLDSRQFCHVIKNLIKHESMQIRRRSLGLLNNKLRKSEPTDHETTLMITMIDDLLSSIQLSKSEQISIVDAEINNQTVLFSIKLLCKRIGEQNPLAFAKVLKFLSENLINLSSYVKGEFIHNSNLLSSVLLCIGEVCLKLKSNSLSNLNQIMTFTLTILDLIETKIGTIDLDLIDEYNSKTTKLENKFKNYELLALSCVTCLLKIVQNLSNFLSPYLTQLVHLSCSMSHLVRLGLDQPSSPPNIELKLNQLRHTLTKQVPLRLLAPILSQQSADLLNPNAKNKHKMKIKHVEFYMQMARMAIQNSNHEDLITNLKPLRSMFMSLFEIRCTYAKVDRAVKISKKKQPLEVFLVQKLNRYEEFVIGAFVELTFKLSEDLFKPIFFKVYEWATCSNPSNDRLITFYRMTLRLSDKLKNLFVIFAPQFTQNAANLLIQLNTNKTEEKQLDKLKEKETILLYSIVDTLANVFLNDTQRTYVNKERFNVLMEPLVDQIENEIDSDEYNVYIGKHLAPCIANLAYCVVNDEGLLRKFNYQLLLKTKHNSVQVRLAALDVLSMFCKKVGDVYNSFLSETVPFLAELMEDPVEEVEDKVQIVIKDLEDILGESLQSHFA